MNEKVSHVHDMIAYLCEGGCSINTCTKDGYRSVARGRPPVSRKYLRAVILKLKKIIKRNIKAEMKSSGVGSVAFDSWSRGGIHYCGTIASYNRRDGSEVKVRTALLGCTPLMSGVPLETYVEENGTTSTEDVQVVQLEFEDETRESIVFTS